MIEISISDEDFSRALRQLKSVPYGIQKAMYPAVAETMQHVRDVLVEYLIGEIPLPQKALKRAVLLGKPISRGGTVSAGRNRRPGAAPGGQKLPRHAAQRYLQAGIDPFGLIFPKEVMIYEMRTLWP